MLCAASVAVLVGSSEMVAGSSADSARVVQFARQPPCLFAGRKDLERPLTQKQLLSALRQNCENLLASLPTLQSSKRLRAARAQGFANTFEFLGHICAWFEELLWPVPKRMRREPVAYSWRTVKEFNARAMARYREWRKPEVVEEFRCLLGRVEALVVSLSDEDLALRHVYEWIHNAAVGHPLEHRLRPEDQPKQEQSA